jgi:hypothetical protein|tara:strand:- start:213 stop:383 length:171 start_codon:yes stop_codon:yes gene_type:complete
MKYLKHIETIGDEKVFRSYQPEGQIKFIPHDTKNMDYVRMTDEVAAGTSTIEEVED